jgi:hypothetical protein
MNSERCALSQHARIKRRGNTREAHRSEASLLHHDVVLAGPFQRAGGVTTGADVCTALGSRQLFW